MMSSFWTRTCLIRAFEHDLSCDTKAKLAIFLGATAGFDRKSQSYAAMPTVVRRAIRFPRKLIEQSTMLSLVVISENDIGGGTIAYRKGVSFRDSGSD